MSFVKVGALAASAAAAALGSASAMPTAHTPIAIVRARREVSSMMFALPLEFYRSFPINFLSDGHLHIGIRPAALEPEAALARLVVGLDAQQVLARRGKGCRRGDRKSVV